MKKKVPSALFWRKVMRISLLHFFFSLTLITLCQARTGLAQELLDRKVTLFLSNQPVGEVLDKLGRSAQVSFMYSPEIIQSRRSVTIRAREERLDDILRQLFRPLRISYEVVGSRILLKRSPRTEDAAALVDVFPGEEVPDIQALLTGRVTDEVGAGVPGASVRVKGTATGTVTNNDGRFALNATEEKGLLVVSSVGYITQELPFGTQTTNLDITLRPDTKSLDEVVVVGYGSEQKKDLTGSVASLSGKNIAERQTMQVSEALQGALAGVTVTRNSGAPGATSTIRIRGITTIGNNDPLVIVDGVPNGNINNLNPNDIENITVLKDGASASIYGSRAAAGVILVTTKRAKDGQASFDYNYEFGMQSPTQLPSYVNVPRYMSMFNEMQVNDGGTGLYAKDLIDNFDARHKAEPDKYPATDWQRLIIGRTAPRHRHDLSFAIGTGKLKTKASLSYSKVDGLYVNRQYDRYTVRVNNDMRINKIVSANFDIFYKRTAEVSPAGENPVYASRIFPGIYDDRYEDGRWAPGKEGRNPLAQIHDGGTNRGTYNQLGGRLVFDVRPVEGLSLTAIISPTLDFNKSKNFAKVIQYTALNNPAQVIYKNQANTILNEGRTEMMTFNGQLLANYSKLFREHHQFDALLGYEENYAFSESLGASREGFTITDFPYLNLGSLTLRANSGSATESALRSGFSRVKYNYKNKYYLQANVRLDGSSRFYKDYRWGVFPSVSAGWTISEEPFLKSLPAISYLKVRGSWGQIGNERIGDYPYQASIEFNNNALFYQGNQLTAQSAGAQVTYAVKDITWETTESIDAGLDLSFFHQRLSLTADYFRKRTRDILLSLDIPKYLGYENPSQNAGVVEAKGWELEAGWKDHVGKLNYSIGVNLSDTRTTIVSLKGTQLRGDNAKLEGGEFDEWFGYRSSGLFQTAEEVKNAPVLNANVKPGDIKYLDLNGDGKITPEGDKVLLGGSLPRYVFGGNIRLEYKGFDLGLVFQGVGKINRRLADTQVMPFGESFGNAPAEIDGNYWSTSNTAERNLLVRYPRLSQISAGNNYQMSDFWLINGAYFRLKNLTIGYNLPQAVAKRLSMQGLRVYVAGNDLFTLNRFPKGWDPEVDATTYPVVKTLMAGINLKF